MGIHKNVDVQNYDFVEFSSSTKKIIADDYQDVEFRKPNKKFKSLINEVNQANKNEFIIDKEVFDLRQHRVAKKNELEKKIEERIQHDLIKIKDQAYQEGFQKGLQDGIAKAYEEERDSTQKKIKEMKAMVDNLLNRQDEIVKTQEHELNKLIRDLTKWIILRELKNDDDYISRLVSKIVEENKTALRISFQVGRGITASFSRSIHELNQELQNTYHGQVEIIENKKIDKDAIEVQLDSNVLRANLSEQLDVFNQIFDIVGEE